MGEKHVFSKRRGCLHAALLWCAVFLSLAVVAMAFSKDPEQLGALAAGLLPIVGGIGFLASYDYQRGHRRITPVLVVLLWAGLIMSVIGPLGGHGVTEAERNHLEVSQTAIRHSDFRFALPHPGPAFHLTDLPPAMLEKLTSGGAGEKLAAWMLQNEDSSAVVLILAVKSLDLSRETAFDKFADAMRRPIVAGTDAEIVEDRVTWEPDLHEFRLGVRTRTGIYGSLRCLGSLSVPPIGVCVFTWTGTANGLELVRNGLAFEPPKPSGPS